MKQTASVHSHSSAAANGPAWDGLSVVHPRTQLYLERTGRVLRARSYSKSTAKAYRFWINRFLATYPRANPIELGEAEVNEFLTQLAIKENVAASTQNQAL
jgi:hypothetical protein